MFGWRLRAGRRLEPLAPRPDVVALPGGPGIDTVHYRHRGGRLSNGSVVSQLLLVGANKGPSLVVMSRGIFVVDVSAVVIDYCEWVSMLYNVGVVQ